MNSECSGNLVFMNFYEFVHTNFIFVHKTSNLSIRIHEGFQHGQYCMDLDFDTSAAQIQHKFLEICQLKIESCFKERKIFTILG